MDLLKKQQTAGATSLTQLLRLKQDEEQEKLRKVSIFIMLYP